MKNTYTRGDYELPRCTNIISDCTDKSAPLTMWAANQVVEWIKENCEYYEISNGKWEYGVTDKHLNDARFNFRDVSKEATDIGTEVHGLIEAYLKTGELPLGKIEAWKPETALAFEAFLNWEKENDLKPISLEQTVYGDYWAGTLDFYGYFNGKLYVIDWKSSAGHYPEMRYQVAAYRWARGEHIEAVNDFVGDNLKIEGCGVLRLDKKTGLPDWKDTSKSYERDLRIFNRMKDLYFERHPIISKKAGKEQLWIK